MARTKVTARCHSTTTLMDRQHKRAGKAAEHKGEAKITAQIKAAAEKMRTEIKTSNAGAKGAVKAVLELFDTWLDSSLTEFNINEQHIRDIHFGDLFDLDVDKRLEEDREKDEASSDEDGEDSDVDIEEEEEEEEEGETE